MPRRWLGLIGDPVHHSLSPSLFNRFFCEIGYEDHIYEAVRLKPDDLAHWVISSKGNRFFYGCNVTAPHKQTIMPLLDDLDRTAIASKAVNVVWKNSFGKMVGYNTDSLAYQRSLTTEHDVSSLKNNAALILGASGAASAVVLALHRLGIKPLYIANRTLAKAETLANSCFGKAVPWIRIKQILPEVNLVVNATPIGWDNKHEPFPVAWLRKQHLVSDLVYRLTPWIKGAKKKGITVHTGFGMFIYQLAETLNIWFGRTLPYPVLARWAREVLDN